MFTYKIIYKVNLKINSTFIRFDFIKYFKIHSIPNIQFATLKKIHISNIR